MGAFGAALSAPPAEPVEELGWIRSTYRAPGVHTTITGLTLYVKQGRKSKWVGGSVFHSTCRVDLTLGRFFPRLENQFGSPGWLDQQAFSCSDKQARPANLLSKAATKHIFVPSKVRQRIQAGPKSIRTTTRSPIRHLDLQYLWTYIISNRKSFML